MRLFKGQSVDELWFATIRHGNGEDVSARHMERRQK